MRAGAIIADLARTAGGGIFHLLDLAEKPDAGDPDLRLFRKDKESLKRELFTRFSAEGKKVTPVMIEKALAGFERKDAALQAVEAIEGAGGKAYYHSVNLLRHEDMATVMRQVRKGSDHIDVLIRRTGDQPIATQQIGGRVRPRVRRQGRWLVQYDGFFRQFPDRQDDGLQFHRRPFRQRRTRPTTARPMIFCVKACPT